MRFFKNIVIGLTVVLGFSLLLVLGGQYLSTRAGLLQQRSARFCDADAVAFSPNGKLVAVTCSRDLVYICRFPQLDQVTKLQAKDGRAFQTAFFPDKDYLAVAEWAGQVTLWDTKQWKKVAEISTPGRASAVALSPDGRWLAASVGADGWCLVVWQTKGYREVYRFKSQGTSRFGPGFACVAFLDSQTLAAGGFDGCVYVWDLRTGQLLKRLCGHIQPIWRIAALPTEGLIASSSMDNTVVVWDWRRSKQVMVTPGSVVASCPTRGLFAVSSGTSPVILQLWDARSSRMVASQTVQEQNIMDMAFSADGNYLVTVGNGTSVIIWRIER